MSADILAKSPFSARAERKPTWFWAAAGLGVIWNAYGTFQFFQAVTATRESLVTMGMSETQAQTMSSYPLWMTVAFAVGTFGGLVGSGLLFLRRKIAVPVLIASLLGYVVLYIGDITEGIFAALGSGQVTVLSLVVAIASGLVWASRHADRNGILA